MSVSLLSLPMMSLSKQTLTRAGINKSRNQPVRAKRNTAPRWDSRDSQISFQETFQGVRVNLAPPYRNIVCPQATGHWSRRDNRVRSHKRRRNVQTEFQVVQSQDVKQHRTFRPTGPCASFRVRTQKCRKPRPRLWMLPMSSDKWSTSQQIDCHSRAQTKPLQVKQDKAVMKSSQDKATPGQITQWYGVKFAQLNQFHQPCSRPSVKVIKTDFLF